MSPADIAAYHGEFVVVETEDTLYLGTIRVDRRRGQLTVYTGFTGRPPIIALSDVEGVTPAADHPAVVAG